MPLFPEHWRRWLPISLWVVIVAGIYLRFRVALEFNPIHGLFSDPGRHWQYGLNPLLADPLSAMDPVMYQLWLTLVAKLTLGAPLAIGIYAALLGVFTTWVWYRVMREALAERTLALAGWAALLWLPSWVGMSSYFMTETLLLPMLGLALWFTFRSMRLRTMESFVWCIAFWTGASLTRSFAVPLAVVSLWFLCRVHEQRAKKLFITAVIAVCASIPPAYRTYQILRVWSPFGYTLMNQIYLESGRRDVVIQLNKNNGLVGWRYGFASPSMGTEPLRPLSHWTSSRSGAVHVTIDIEKGSHDWMSALRDSWGGFPLHVRMWWENTVYTTFGESWPDDNPKHYWEWLSLRLRWMWAPMLLFVIVGNIVYAAKRKEAPLLLVLSLTAILGCYFVPATPTEGRYRKQIEGLLIVNTLWLASTKAKQKPKHKNEPVIAS